LARSNIDKFMLLALEKGAEVQKDNDNTLIVSPTSREMQRELYFESRKLSNVEVIWKSDRYKALSDEERKQAIKQFGQKVQQYYKGWLEFNGKYNLVVYYKTKTGKELVQKLFRDSGFWDNRFEDSQGKARKVYLDDVRCAYKNGEYMESDEWSNLLSKMTAHLEDKKLSYTLESPLELLVLLKSEKQKVFLQGLYKYSGLKVLDKETGELKYTSIQSKVQEQDTDGIAFSL